MKKILVAALLLSIVIIDVYLVYTFVFNNNQSNAPKEVITIEEKKENTQTRTSEKNLEKNSEKNQISTTLTIKTKKQTTTEKKIQNSENRRKKEEEIDQLIEKIIEEAKMEYHFKNRNKDKESIIKKLFNFGN